MSAKGNEFKQYIRDIPDFPQKGIIFRDITNLLKNGPVFQQVIDTLADEFRDQNIDLVCSVEARGFIVGAALAQAIGAGFVPIRKKGKLPWDTHSEEYDLEYGKDEVEIHRDAVQAGQRALFVDDLIATGGTAKASIDLIKKMHGEVVHSVFLIELSGLGGREKLSGVPVYALMEY